jgi:signal peptidase I
MTKKVRTNQETTEDTVNQLLDAMVDEAESGNAPLDPKRDIAIAEDDNQFFELVKTAAIAFVLAMVLRSLAFEPFSIPSGSMIPSLLVGDYLFVSKYSYGYSRYSFPGAFVYFPNRLFFKAPERGDVAVFKKPNEESIDYIKRIIGLPNDTVQVIDGVLYINDTPVKRSLIADYQAREPFGNMGLYHLYEETLPNGKTHKIIEKSDEEALDNTPRYTVPLGHYFVMGDNRDGSQDSRVMDKVGFVPEENLVGRAEVLFFSIEEGYRGWHFWAWPWSVRFGRLFNLIQ